MGFGASVTESFPDSFLPLTSGKLLSSLCSCVFFFLIDKESAKLFWTFVRTYPDAEGSWHSMQYLRRNSTHIHVFLLSINEPFAGPGTEP